MAKVKIMVKITLLGVETEYEFDNLGYITVNGIKYSAVQLLHETQQNTTALKYLRDQKDADVDKLLDSWGLEEEGAVEEKDQEGLPDREDDKTNPDELGDPNAKPEEVAQTTDTSSITETISILRGWKTKDGKVVYKKDGKPEKTSDKSPQLSISDSAIVEIGSDGSINITGDVQINVPDKKDTIHIIKDGKFAIKFGKITGNFKCQSIGLISLANAPKTVTGTFDCSKNKLTTLVGGPDSVGIFIAHSNKTLTSLAGGPKIINGITDSSKSQKEHIYDVSSCGLTSLDGNGITTFGPGGFNCGDNKLTALSGLDSVSSAGVTKFDCSKNLLTSLVGIPNSRKDTKTGKPGDYNISGNVDIKTFPSSMQNLEVDEFRASGLSLTSLSFAPKQVYGNFDCNGNKGSTKLTNQTIGKDRFKIGGGFEEDAGNRIVKIDGSFISPEGSWSDKTYDINTVFKAGQSMSESLSGSSSSSASSGPGGKVFNLNKGGGKFTHGPVHLVEIPNPLAIELGYVFNGSKNDVYTFSGYSAGDGWLRNKKYRNYINWCFFEKAGYGWSKLQPTGAFIINGQNLGAKTQNRSWQNMVYKPKGKNPLLGKSASDFYVGPPNDSSWGGKDEFPEKFSGGIKGKTGGGTYKPLATTVSWAAGGGINMIRNGQVVADVSVAGYGQYTSWPFFGYTTDGQYFAGCSTPNPDIGTKRKSTDGSWRIDEIATVVNNHFKSKGKTVDRCINGDGGGSGTLVVDGVVYQDGDGRTVPVVIYW